MLTRLVFILALLSLIPGCATPIDLAAAEAGGWRFGLTRIHRQPTTDRLVVQELSTLGLWRQRDTAGLGFARTSEVHVPLDCQVVVVVSNEEQLQSVTALLKELATTNQETLCIGQK